MWKCIYNVMYCSHEPGVSLDTTSISRIMVIEGGESGVDGEWVEGRVQSEQVEGGLRRWRVEGGGWRVEGGGWRMEGGD